MILQLEAPSPALQSATPPVITSCAPQGPCLPLLPRSPTGLGLHYMLNITSYATCTGCTSHVHVKARSRKQSIRVTASSVVSATMCTSLVTYFFAFSVKTGIIVRAVILRLHDHYQSERFNREYVALDNVWKGSFQALSGRDLQLATDGRRPVY